MSHYYVNDSFNKQYDDMVRRTFKFSESSPYFGRSTGFNEDRFVKISTIYEPSGGYTGDSQLQVTGREVIFRYDGTTEEGQLNFDPDDTSDEEQVGYVNVGKPIYIIDVDFDPSSPQDQLEIYQGKIVRVSQFNMVDASDEYEAMWVGKLGGVGGTSSQEVHDCVVSDVVDASRYKVDAWLNYHGRAYAGDGDNATPVAMDATMIIEGATGPALKIDNVIPCRAHIEYHNAPIGEEPEPPDPLPPDYTPPPPPWATVVYRPITLWRYYS